MLNRRSLCRTILLLLAILPWAARGADTRELRVVGTHFARVYEHRVPDGYVGLGPDLLREIGKRLGATVRFEIYPWARAQLIVEQGEADILVGPYKTPERERRFSFSDKAFYQDHMLFYSRAGGVGHWSGNYSTLHGKRIAIVHGWAYGPSFEQARSVLHLSTAQTLENGLLMVLHEHVELLASNERNTNAMLASMGMTGKIVAIPQIIEVQNGYFAFPRMPRYDDLRTRFNVEFNRMVASGELAKIARQHNVHVP